MLTAFSLHFTPQLRHLTMMSKQRGFSEIEMGCLKGLWRRRPWQVSWQVEDRQIKPFRESLMSLFSGYWEDRGYVGDMGEGRKKERVGHSEREMERG